MSSAKLFTFEGEQRTAKEVSKIYTARGLEFCRKALNEGLTTIAEFNARESKNTAKVRAGGKAGADSIRDFVHRVAQKTRTLHVYSDAGHGWVRVPRAWLAKYGIAQAISSFSYQRGDYVYLEEDCDMPLIDKALRKNGITPKYFEHQSNKASRIRGYDRYEQDAPNE